jgi:hypothetical protein
MSMWNTFALIYSSSYDPAVPGVSIDARIANVTYNSSEVYGLEARFSKTLQVVRNMCLNRLVVMPPLGVYYEKISKIVVLSQICHVGHACTRVSVRRGNGIVEGRDTFEAGSVVWM